MTLPAGSKKRQQCERQVANGCIGSLKVEDVGNEAAFTVRNSRWRLLGTDSCDATLNSTIRGSIIDTKAWEGRRSEVSQRDVEAGIHSGGQGLRFHEGCSVVLLFLFVFHFSLKN